MKKFLFIITFFLVCFSAQSTEVEIIDSILEEYKQEKSDTGKILQLLELCRSVRRTHYDTAFYYYNQALAEGEKIGNHSLIGRTYTEIANTYMAIVWNLDLAKNNFSKAIDHFKLTNDKAALANATLRTGVIYYMLGDFDKALQYYFDVIKICEKSNEIGLQGDAYMNIGIIYTVRKTYDKAFEYYSKAADLYQLNDNAIGVANIYTNIGINFEEQKEYDKALEYYNKTELIYEMLKDVRSMALSHINLGNVQKKLGNLEIGLKYYEKARQVFEETGDNAGKALVYLNLADLYVSIANRAGSNADKIKFSNLSIHFGEKALKLSNEAEALAEIQEAALYLKNAYLLLNDYKTAMEYAELYIQTTDSLFGEEKTEAIANAEAEWQSEKKQLEIEKLEKEQALKDETIARKDAENKRQAMFVWFLGLIVVIILVFAVFMIRVNAQKKKANEKLAYQNSEILQKNEEITAQRDEIESQRDKIEAQAALAMKHTQHIEQINEEITDSIHYAKRIQGAILPRPEYAQSLLREYFVLFRPKDIVSGDFYWMTHVEGVTIVAVADCTGHGVPGAFMSMLGAAFLNEVINKEYITHPGVILRKLRKEVIKALQQKGETGEQKDGMDMSLCSIDMEKLELHFSGANNPIYIVRNGEKGAELETLGDEKYSPIYSYEDASLYEIKGDKMPIAIHIKMDRFITNEIKLKRDDQIYLFTDGFADQFGGDSGKKFKYKPFKKILVENSHASLAEQKRIMDQTLDTWCQHIDPLTGAPYEQIDDITVMGIRI